MSNRFEDLPAKIKELTPDQEESSKLAGAIVEAAGGESYVKEYKDLSAAIVEDVREALVYGMLRNMRKPECVDIGKQIVESYGTQVKDSTIRRLYDKCKKDMDAYRPDSIEVEIKRFVSRMNRLALKAEANGDIGNAIKAVKEMGQILGVYEGKDDSKVVINFGKAEETVIEVDKEPKGEVE